MPTRAKPLTNKLNRGCRAVLTALKAKSLTSAQELHFAMRAKDESAPGLTTVYRSLETLVGLGLVQAVEIGDGEKRFEPIEIGKHHHHLVCQSCQKSVHLDECIIESLDTKVFAQHGFKIKSHVLELFGLCKACQKQKKLRSEKE